MRGKIQVIVVDDEPLAGCHMVSLLGTCDDVVCLGVFRRGRDALAFLEENTVDLAFLDIEMPGMDGLALAERMRAIDPFVEFVFVTGYGQYSLAAFEQYALGYLLKPCDRTRMLYYLEQARYLREKRSRSVLHLRTFGSFDAFVKGEPVLFSNAKAKELLALLADARGGQVGMEKACDLLWEMHPYDESVKALYRRAVSDLRKTLGEYCGPGVLRAMRGAISLNASVVSCDYWRYLEGESELFSGEYLSQYSWGEATLARLTLL